MSSSEPREPRDPSDPPVDDMDEILDAEDIAEEIPEDDDLAMDSDDDLAMDPDDVLYDGEGEITLENDSIAYFDLPRDSLFSIAQHPVHPSLIAVGGSAGKEEKAPGAGWVFDTSAAVSRPVLPASYASDPAAASEAPKSTQLDSLFSINGHEDSINALAWTLPRGEILVSGGLDGRIFAWKATTKPGSPLKMDCVGQAHEVSEIAWIAPCPSPAHPNHIAVGTAIIPEDPEEAPQYHVYVFKIDPSDKNVPLQITNCYVLHSSPCTAGAWTPDGLLLATVDEGSNLYVWDVWGEAAAKGLGKGEDRPIIALTGTNKNFYIKGGLFSIAIDPHGAWVAVGGGCPHEKKEKEGGGFIRIVSLPRLAAQPQDRSRGARGKASVKPTAGGVIIQSIAHSDDSIESLSVTVASVTPPTTLLAAGSAAGSIAVYETTRFSQRRAIPSAHNNHAVVKVEFIPNTWRLTSCGTDGAVRRWDFRGSGTTTQGESGMQKEWKGHRYDGDIQGVMGFVQGETGERVVTVGDDGVALVFEF